GNKSKSSNPVVVVLVDPPSAPENLTAAVTASSVFLEWDDEGNQDVAGYNVYRKSVGDWQQINTSDISDKIYSDSNLPSGVYAYRVTAENVQGIESLPSNEVSVIVDVPPAPPRFYQISSPLGCRVAYQGQVDITGAADSGNTISLFKDEKLVTTSNSSSVPRWEHTTLDYWGEGAALSPDGKTLVYVANQTLWLLDLNMETPKSIAEGTIIGGSRPEWSWDGTKIAHLFYDEFGNQRIGIFKIESGISSPLTEDTPVNEGSPSWTATGNSLAFVSNRGGALDVWEKDLGTGEISQITDGAGAFRARINPKGDAVAYSVGADLYTLGLNVENPVLVDQQVNSNSIAWSPDNSQLAYIATRTGQTDIFVRKDGMADPEMITNTAEVEFNLAWSPAGQTILFGVTRSDGTRSILAAPVVEPESLQPIQDGLGGVNDLSWIGAGAISYIENMTLYLYYVEGYFAFPGIVLLPGDNNFSAISTDVLGKNSASSDKICIHYDTSRLPDLTINEDTILLFPNLPVAGEELVITAPVYNSGQIEAKNVAVDLFVLPTSGDLEWLGTTHVPLIPGGTEVVVSATWNTTNRAGLNTVIVNIDPEDQITEMMETNNLVEHAFYVAKIDGIDMTTFLDADEYHSHQDVVVDVRLMNAGVDLEGVLEVWIEDENGKPVTLLNTINTTMQYASEQNYREIWNTGTVFSDSYQVHTLIESAGNIIAEGKIPFTIVPEIEIDSSVNTDKVRYGSDETVFIDFDVMNLGVNHVIPSADVQVTITDAVNNERFVQNQTVLDLFPSGIVALRTDWPTELNSPGEYFATVKVDAAGDAISSSTTSFSIVSEAVITGTISVAPSVIVLGRSVHIDYLIQNT
ncbi:MAG: hypothetical protein OEQ53_19935, partial [Saprospiraceae bacterium]|nr:hypothetical protein [Saprospiraceae bacterium]